jgi:hypothetical protein
MSLVESVALNTARGMGAETLGGRIRTNLTLALKLVIKIGPSLQRFDLHKVHHRALMLGKLTFRQRKS